MQKNRINQIEPYITKEDKNELIKYVNSGGWITEHSQNKIFEDKFKKITKSKYAITFPNGTLTLFGILLSINIKKGDEIIVPNFTIISCVNEMIREGVKPIFIEADPNTFNIDVDKIESKITKKTKAILIAHIYGLPVDLKKIIKQKKKT